MKRHNIYLLIAGLLIFAGCTVKGSNPELKGKTVEITFIHTTDIHSRLFPYYMNPTISDKNLGLDPSEAPYGGAARIAYIVRKVRKGAQRSLYIDTGDWFQGAPVFNIFHGEPEVRVMGYMGLDVACVGNHDFDLGASNLAYQLGKWASFPVLAANYRFTHANDVEPPPLASILKPYVIFNLKGIKVAVIGFGNTSTMSTIMETGNKYGITPIDAAEVLQYYIDMLKDRVNIIIGASHLGLNIDQYVINHTTGLDIMFGGHHHVVLDPPKIVMDCQSKKIQEKYNCKPRKVLLVHSGAFAKYVGVLHATFAQSKDDPNNWEVVSSSYKPYPVDKSVPEDAYVKEILEWYFDELKKEVPLDMVVGYAPHDIKRFGTTGGDSALGNIVAESMWRRQGVQTDFALTNTTGMRADMYQGAVTVEDMYNIFPWQNTITKMYLSGRDVIEVFDYSARKTQSRGCVSQIQVAGAKVVMYCGPCTDVMGHKKNGYQRPDYWPKPQAPDKACAVDVRIRGRCPEYNDWCPVNPDGQYEMATSNYISHGGSGYSMLRANTTQQDTGINMRDALIDYIMQMKPCYAQDDGKPAACHTDKECQNTYNSDMFMCACDGRYAWENGQCSQTDGCPQGGRCVLKACVKSVTSRYALQCNEEMKPGEPRDKCECIKRNMAGQECAKSACLNESNHVEEDGRVKVVLP